MSTMSTMSSGELRYRRLRELRDRLTWPPPWREPEISGHAFVMAMSPPPRHQLTSALVGGRLGQQLRPGLIAPTSTDTEDVGLGELRVPDLLVVDERAMDSDDPLDPREILLAVEIVSPSNPENDYTAKARAYPAMGIERYLIVDPRDGTATAFHGIGREDGRPAYENRRKYTYGDTVSIGDWRIETGGLPRYSEKDMRI